MRRKPFSIVMLWLMLFAQVVVGQQPVNVQAPAKQGGDVEATDVRPSDDFQGPMGIDASRKTLAEKFFAWGRQMDVKARINDELKKNFKGTPEEALRFHLMEIVAMQDQESMGSAIARAAENYRYQCGRAMSMTLQDLKTEQVTLNHKKEEINTMLMTLDTGKDVAGRELSPEELVWAKKRLRTLLNHRSDVNAAIEVDKANATFYRDELLALVKLDRYLDGWASDLSAHVERVVDAAERERKVLLLKDVQAEREQIRNFFTIFERAVGTDQKIVPPNRDRIDQREPGAQKIVENLQKEPPLTPEEDEMVEAELERFRQGRGAKMP
jgi:hypothetical protein